MSELEEKLGSILNDPNMMQQIMGMAKMLSGAQEDSSGPDTQPTQKNAPVQVNDNLVKAISGIASQGGIDSSQDHLLKALQPYLSHNRICKLERAMSAARMAHAASAFLNAGGGKLLGMR